MSGNGSGGAECSSSKIIEAAMADEVLAESVDIAQTTAEES